MFFATTPRDRESNRHVEVKEYHLFNNTMFNIMVTLGVPVPGTKWKVYQINWLAPGARPHLQELGKQGISEMCSNAPSVGQSLKMLANLESNWSHLELSSSSPGRAGGVKKDTKPLKTTIPCNFVIACVTCAPKKFIEDHIKYLLGVRITNWPYWPKKV